MLTYLFIVYFYLILQMSIVWLIYRKLKNPSVVDVSWSIGIMMAGLIYLYSHSLTPRIALISGLLILWSLRLASYLWFTRIRKGHIDKRYTQLSKDWKVYKSLGFFLNFQLQACLIFIISCVFFFISKTEVAALSLWDAVASLIVLLGILGESIADLQLQRFKAKNKGQVCNIGLWRYSRHPNYFFDWITWCGFALFSLSAPYGWIGLISPICLYIIFTQITGPITEKGSIESRGQAFIDYQKKTPLFFPSLLHK